MSPDIASTQTLLASEHFGPVALRDNPRPLRSHVLAGVGQSAGGGGPTGDVISGRSRAPSTRRSRMQRSGLLGVLFGYPPRDVRCPSPVGVERPARALCGPGDWGAVNGQTVHCRRRTAEPDDGGLRRRLRLVVRHHVDTTFNYVDAASHRGTDERAVIAGCFDDRFDRIVASCANVC